MSTNSFSSSSRAALITGGGRRIGAALALRLAENGFDIALHCHRSVEEAEQVRRQIETKGRQCEILIHDLADTSGFAGLIASSKDAFPHLDVLVNNASVFERASFMESDEALFNRQFTVNLKAPVFLTQAFARAVKTGHVINLLDTHVNGTGGSHFMYLLSKKALAEFTPMAARALGPDIRVNAVCPGMVLPTDQYDEGHDQRLADRLPLKELASVGSVCDAVSWLLSQRHVTGQLIYVDSGEHLL